MRGSRVNPGRGGGRAGGPLCLGRRGLQDFDVHSLYLIPHLLTGQDLGGGADQSTRRINS